MLLIYLVWRQRIRISFMLMPILPSDSALNCFTDYIALLVYLLSAVCTMASISTAAMSVSESAMATLSSSSAAFGSCGAQQLAPLRSPARLNASRIVAVRASRSSKVRI
jgi:hypothetical protein